MRIGIFQPEAGKGEPSDRLRRLESAIEERGLDLVVCPELFMSGYDVGEDLRQLAQPRDGEFAEKISELARVCGTAIAYGYPEHNGDALYNSAQVVSAEGQLLANHRKLMLPPGFEAEYFDAGNKLTVFELAGLKFGLLICYDAEFPESVRACAQAGADVVLVPTALGQEWPVVAEQVMPARGFENGIWLCYANHAGNEAGRRYLGRSCIVAPDGSDAARAGDSEALIVAEVSAEPVRRAQKRLPNLSAARRLSAVLGR
ncbi:MAG: carbon-nitrogen hydrolase family protein [Rhodobacteraceae bacterium]|nr:carbon-nitrogen hydrolase family protein [Paracoccaceae bacterium]